MKRLCAFLFLLQGFLIPVVAQNTSQNYILTRTMINDSTSLHPVIPILPDDTLQGYILTRTTLNDNASLIHSAIMSTYSYIEKIQYFDGLGRLSMTVEKGITPTHQNLMSLTDYDGYGRLCKQWLPFDTIADYLTADVFKAKTVNRYKDSLAYNTTIYESSPLSRVTEKGGPGTAWSGKTVKTDYLTNIQGDEFACRIYTVSDEGGLISGNLYPDSTLYVQRLTDEDGHLSYTFTDNLGQQVMTRKKSGSIYSDTYYVYDGYHNLCFVLQPEYQTNPSLDLYAFQYKYDVRNRCIEKKEPGAQSIKYVYDTSNRLSFSQDGVQRTRSEWTFYLYDKFRRLVLQGTCGNTNTSDVGSLYIQTTFTSTAGSGIGGSGYTSSFGLVSPVVETANYYDNYDFRTLSAFASGDYPAPKYPAKGFLTATITTELGTGNKLGTAFYYNGKEEIIKTLAYNHLGGEDVTMTDYTFTGKPKRVGTLHYPISSSSRIEFSTYIYDHADRLTKHNYDFTNTGIVTLAGYGYDELGRLKVKTLNGNYRQSYSYNIRNQMTGISGNSFSESLYYTDGSGIPCYNGNISSMKWQSGNETTTRGYKFAYDNLDRMTTAQYGEGTSLSDNINHYTENITGYTKNGAITGLQRYGKTTNNDYGLIDNLTYTLSGNELKKVTNASTNIPANNGMHFVDGANQDTEYTYDANGNLTQDLNKGINITYNVLDLPNTVTTQSGTVNYLYTADGVKRQVKHGTNTTDYADNLVYENGKLSKILTVEGYITLDSLNKPTYHYYLKDHEGNNRVVIDQNGTVEQVNHYYPFGTLFSESTNTATQRYKYNGKELDTDYGLNLYDYGARYYDPILGQWTMPDPKAEKYYPISPYAYCVGNPVAFVDIKGKYIDIYYKDEEGKQQVWRFTGNNKKYPTNSFIKSFLSAYFYDVKNGAKKGNGGGANLKGAAQSTKFTVNVIQTGFGSKNTPMEVHDRDQNFVQWNPREGLETKEGYRLSPATVLEHEFGHGLREAKNSDIHQYNLDTEPGSDKQYKTKEERRVERGAEANTAWANNEFPNNYMRTSHTGKPIETPSPISNTKLSYLNVDEDE
jgi:RHS repeat-associated protein